MEILQIVPKPIIEAIKAVDRLFREPEVLKDEREYHEAVRAASVADRVADEDGAFAHVLAKCELHELKYNSRVTPKDLVKAAKILNQRRIN